MNTDQLRDVLSWIKSTDLVEVSYKKGDMGFSLASTENVSQQYPSVVSHFTPVVSPCVGIFQWNEPGKARQHEEGAQVAEGDVLGTITTAKGRAEQVKAPASGRLARVMIDGGAGVEYGQPLFFLEPR